MGPLSIEQVLSAEARAIYDLTDPETKTIVDDLERLASGQAHQTMRFDKDADTRSGKNEERDWVANRKSFYCQLGKVRSAALCCSGGGIRSATFCLGIIQALAKETLAVLPAQPTTLPDPCKTSMPDLLEREANLSFLSRFHYLSTVSGGGYIGSWLSAWRSLDDFPTVWQNLRSRPDGPDVEPPENPYVAWHAITHPRGANNRWKGDKAYPTLQRIGWSSVTPFALEDSQVKYAATPCSQQAQYGGPGDTFYYLQQRLQARLDPRNNNHICLDLQVQLRNDPPGQPIDNTLVAWSDVVTGWQKVARIDIYPQAFTSLAQQRFCERLAYDPYQGLKVHAPLGGINRARGAVLPAVYDARLQANGWKRFAPDEITGDETFN